MFFKTFGDPSAPYFHPLISFAESKILAFGVNRFLGQKMAKTGYFKVLFSYFRGLPLQRELWFLNHFLPHKNIAWLEIPMSNFLRV